MCIFSNRDTDVINVVLNLIWVDLDGYFTEG